MKHSIWRRELSMLLLAATLLLALSACGKAQVKVPVDKEEAYRLTGTYISEDKITVISYILHCYADQTLVLECHQNQDGTWSEREDGGLDMTIGETAYMATKSKYTGKIAFKYNDTIGSQELTVRLETAMDDSMAAAATDQMIIETYAGTVAEMARQYAGQEGEVIFYDASNFVRWETLEEDMEGYPVQNKSFGGSNDASRYHYIQELIYNSKPAVIVTINDSNNWTRGQTAEDNIAFKEHMLNEIGENLPDTVVIYLSSLPTPLRYYGDYHDNMVRSDQWLQQYCAENENCVYLDAVPSLSLDNGAKPNEAIWSEDALHLNAEGYKLLAQLVRETLDQVCQARSITFAR